MAYTITRSDGSTITVSDNTVDTTYSVQLVGKNRTNYGVPINENFIRLMQNFANTAAPANPLPGQTWWDTASGGVMKVYAGTTSGWKIISGITASATAPPSPTAGDAWFDTTTKQVKVWDGTQWVLIGPGNINESGLNGIVNEVYNGNYVAAVYASNIRVAIVSANSFSISPAITGFEVIKRGINYNVALADIQTIYGNVVGNVAGFSGNLTAGNINAVSGILTVSGNATTGNLNTQNGVFSGKVDVTGNVSAGNISATSGNLSGTLGVTGNATVGNLTATHGQFGGNINVVGNANASLVTATTLNVSGATTVNTISATGAATFNSNVIVDNLTVNAITNLGNVGNVVITGGNSGFVLTTDGSGGLTWANLTASAGTGNVTSGTANHIAFYASTGATVSGSGANLTWNGANLLTVLGTANVTTLNASGNITAGNVSGIGVSVSGNITAGNINAVSGILTVSGNVTAGNISTTGNTSSGNLAVTGVAQVTGNLSAGNLSTTSANVTANVVAGNVLVAAPSATNKGAFQIGSFGSVQTLFEKTSVDTGTKPSTVNFDIQDYAVLYFTNTAQTGNFTVNFRGNTSISLNNILDIGQTSSLGLMVTNGATAVYPTTIRIDGSTITTKWLDGAAPTAGNSNSVDLYSFNITKTAANTYNVLGSFNRFA